MLQPVEVTTEDDRRRFCGLACPSALTPETMNRQRPDASWMLVDEGGDVAARCSLWWTTTPAFVPHDVWRRWDESLSSATKLGFVGHFAARDGAAELLNRACRQLADRGCTTVVGPIDGNTWQRYRVLTERSPEPIFLMEPDNPDDWPGFFAESGFTPLAQYHSALNDDLSLADPRTAETSRQLEERGITLRTLRMDRFEQELRAIHSLSLASFSNNFLYAPIDEESFIAQYRGVQRFVRPELVLLAELGGEPIGFIFAIPDLNQQRRGQSIDTVIVKTMAVHPSHTSVGIGGLLMARCQQAARDLGYRRAIHALFHETNASGKISRHTAKVIRRYTLFAKSLVG